MSNPTILDPEDVALVVKPDGSLEFYLPDSWDDDHEIPDATMALIAVGMKLQQDDGTWASPIVAEMFKE